MVSSGTRAAQKQRGQSWLVGCVVGLFLVGPALAFTGCVRAPLVGTCPDVEVGDLVISEMRGAQAGSYRQWIELYNAGDAPIAIASLRLNFTQVDGTSPVGIVIRDEGVEVGPGEYIVLGGGDPDSFPYIDYDYTPDYHSSTSVDAPRNLYGAGVIELSACDVRVDRVLYKLPASGTLALDGATAPDAAANDDSKLGWCVDIDPGTGPQTGIGLNGSPGEANPPCP